MSQVNVVVQHNPSEILLWSKERPCRRVYGTGLYLSRAIDIFEDIVTVEHCHTEDRECEFILRTTTCEHGHVTIIIIKGEERRIRDIVKREIEHFDCTVKFAN